MFAVIYDRFGRPDVLRPGEMPEPHPGPSQVRIKVKAAGVAPVDLALRSGDSPSAARLALPHIPGVDAAGAIDEVGADVVGWHAGDEVFGAVAIRELGGASAEFAVLDFWAAKPPAMSWEEAGAAGTSIETATRALDRLDLRAGETLLIDGAAGGVGSIAVQLAAMRGAKVLGMGREENRDFIADLGAVPGQGPADKALDAAGAGRLDLLIELTGSPDRVLTIADFDGPAKGVAVSTGELGGEKDGKYGLAQAGGLRVPLEAVFPMAEAAAAHQAASRRPRRGKIALSRLVG